MKISIFVLLFFGNVLLAKTSENEVKTLHTLGYYYSSYFPLEENLAEDRTLRFSVRTPRDAHILLAPSHEADQPVYEIVLGAYNNTVNHIRGRCPCQDEPNASVKAVNLLSAHEFRDFWVQVKSERSKTSIQVGFGNSDTPFHEWRDPRPLKPQYLCFRSATKAEWRYGYKDSKYDLGISKDRRQIVVTATGFGQYFELSDVVSHTNDGITLYFTVRTNKDLQVLMSPSVSTLGDVYLIGIHESGAYIKTRLLGENRATFQQEGFLNERERLRFWITLITDGEISMGKGGSSNPLLRWRDPRPVAPQFLSFAMRPSADEEEYDPSIYADVQYGLGPDYGSFSQQCAPRWRDASVLLPAGAFLGGRYKDKEIYICRTKYQNDLVPGNFILDEGRTGSCYFSWNFSVLQAPVFEVLTGCRMKWIPASLGSVADGSIVAGYQRDKGRYFVARAKHEHHLIVGKLLQNDRIAYVPYEGQEVPFTSYETLVQMEKPEDPSIVSSSVGYSTPFLGKSNTYDQQYEPTIR